MYNERGSALSSKLSTRIEISVPLELSKNSFDRDTSRIIRKNVLEHVKLKEKKIIFRYIV